MSFSGWPQSALDFYAGLEVDNSKAYWSAHRTVYGEDVPCPRLDREENGHERTDGGRPRTDHHTRGLGCGGTRI